MASLGIIKGVTESILGVGEVSSTLLLLYFFVSGMGNMDDQLYMINYIDDQL